MKPAGVVQAHRVATAVAVGLAIVAAWRLAAMTPFMLDAGRTERAFEPHVRAIDDEQLRRPWFTSHNCFTAYWFGAELARSGCENIYRLGHYLDLEEAGATGGAFTIDPYQYPPHFLVVARAMSAVGLGFFEARSVWYFIELASLLAAAAVFGLWLGRAAPAAALLGGPLILAAPITAGTLEIGNAHVLVVALAVLALPAFEKRLDWLGGALLGAAIVIKLFPAALLVYLAVRRRWSAVLWTAGAILLHTALALLVVGPAPFRAFFGYQVERLASGTAFMFARRCIHPLLSNTSLSSLAYKLDRLGLPMDAALVSQLTARCGLVLTAALVLWVAVRDHRRAAERSRLAEARTWLALFVLGQATSPFIPSLYGNIAVLWLLALFAPRTRTIAGAILFALAATIFALTVPLPLGPPSVTFDLCFTLAGQLMALALVLRALLQTPRG